MTSSVAYVYLHDDGMEWEDLDIFLTLHSAMHHAASHMVKYLDRGHPWNECCRFRIEIFSAKSFNNMHLKPSYRYYKIRNLNPDEIVMMKNVLTADSDLTQFFELR